MVKLSDNENNTIKKVRRMRKELGEFYTRAESFDMSTVEGILIAMKHDYTMYNSILHSVPESVDEKIQEFRFKVMGKLELLKTYIEEIEAHILNEEEEEGEEEEEEKGEEINIIRKRKIGNEEKIYG